MKSYEAYLHHPAGHVLPMEEALGIFTALNESFSACQAEDKMDFYNDFLRQAADYTLVRCRWEFMDLQEKVEDNRNRTIEHDSFITKVNVLCRLEEAEGIDTSWRERLGENRKRIGDFACFVTYMTGLSNR